MQHVHYKQHIIITTVAFDPFTGRYIPTTAIAWTKADGSLGACLLDNKSLDQFPSCVETRRFALGAAKAWIDQYEDH
jgi:hypothetical protein